MILNKLTRLVVTLAEVAAKFVANASVATSLRPRRYYKIPKESLEATLDDVEQMVNFFVIEIQRIVFAENIPATAAVRYQSQAPERMLTALGFHCSLPLLLPCQAPSNVGHGSPQHLRHLPSPPRLCLKQGTHRRPPREHQQDHLRANSAGQGHGRRACWQGL